MYRVKAGERHFMLCNSKPPGCLGKHNFPIITTDSHPSFTMRTVESAGTKGPHCQMLYRRVITRPFKSPQVPRAGATHSRRRIKRREIGPKLHYPQPSRPLKRCCLSLYAHTSFPEKGSKVNIKQERDKNSC